MNFLFPRRPTTPGTSHSLACSTHLQANTQDTVTMENANLPTLTVNGRRWEEMSRDDRIFCAIVRMLLTVPSVVSKLWSDDRVINTSTRQYLYDCSMCDGEEYDIGFLIETIFPQPWGNRIRSTLTPAEIATVILCKANFNTELFSITGEISGRCMRCQTVMEANVVMNKIVPCQFDAEVKSRTCRACGAGGIEWYRDFNWPELLIIDNPCSSLFVVNEIMKPQPGDNHHKDYSIMAIMNNEQQVVQLKPSWEYVVTVRDLLPTMSMIFLERDT